MSKILFFSNQGLSPFHLAIELEILNTLREDENHEITVLSCNAKLEGCFYNPTKSPIACALCESRSQTLFKKQGINSKTLENSINEHQGMPMIENLEHLESLEYNGINVGRGVASSFISISRDFSVEDPRHFLKIQSLYSQAVTAYDMFAKALSNYKPNEVYLFNGRFAESHVLIQLCKKNNITYYTHEAASTGNYLVFKNSLPHSIRYRKDLMKEIWEKENEKHREEVAVSFYTNKRKGTFQETYRHTQNQQLNTLPKKWDTSKTNVTIFNSSEDEMKVIDEWKHDYYKSQNQAIKKICSNFLDQEEIHFTLRVHPNLGSVDNEQSREISMFNFKNLSIIKPFDKVDSYALIENSDLVISFGSTIGIEATYLQKPSIMFGRTFYEDENATYNPKSFEELFRLIKEKELNSKPRQNTYRYAYFMSKFGTRFRDLEFRNNNDVSYKDEKIKKWNSLLLIKTFEYLPYLKNWIKLTKIFLNRYPRFSDLGKLYHQIQK